MDKNSITAEKLYEDSSRNRTCTKPLIATREWSNKGWGRTCGKRSRFLER